MTSPTLCRAARRAGATLLALLLFALVAGCETNGSSADLDETAAEPPQGSLTYATGTELRNVALDGTDDGVLFETVGDRDWSSFVSRDPATGRWAYECIIDGTGRLVSCDEDGSDVDVTESHAVEDVLGRSGDVVAFAGRDAAGREGAWLFDPATGEVQDLHDGVVLGGCTDPLTGELALVVPITDPDEDPIECALELYGPDGSNKRLIWTSDHERTCEPLAVTDSGVVFLDVEAGGEDTGSVMRWDRATDDIVTVVPAARPVAVDGGGSVLVAERHAPGTRDDTGASAEETERLAIVAADGNVYRGTQRPGRIDGAWFGPNGDVYVAEGLEDQQHVLRYELHDGLSAPTKLVALPLPGVREICIAEWGDALCVLQGATAPYAEEVRLLDPSSPTGMANTVCSNAEGFVHLVEVDAGAGSG